MVWKNLWIVDRQGNGQFAEASLCDPAQHAESRRLIESVAVWRCGGAHGSRPTSGFEHGPRGSDHAVDPLEIVEIRELDDDAAPLARQAHRHPGVESNRQELFELEHGRFA